VYTVFRLNVTSGQQVVVTLEATRLISSIIRHSCLTRLPNWLRSSRALVIPILLLRHGQPGRRRIVTPDNWSRCRLVAVIAEECRHWLDVNGWRIRWLRVGHWSDGCRHAALLRRRHLPLLHWRYVINIGWSLVIDTPALFSANTYISPHYYCWHFTLLYH